MAANFLMHEDFGRENSASRGGAALARLATAAALSVADRQALLAALEPARRLAARMTLTRAGDPGRAVHVLLSGWMASAVELPDGRRPIVKLHCAGDMLGVASFAARSGDEMLTALTPAVVARIDPAALEALTATRPRIAMLLLIAAGEDQQQLMARLVSVGSTSALSRMAALLLFVHDRERRDRGGSGLAIQLPVTQAEIAELTGLTTVHVNRTFREMSKMGLIRREGWSRRAVTIVDRAALEVAAALPRPRPAG